MPTYQNNTTVIQKFIVQDKSLFKVAAGESIVSQFFTTNEDLTLVSETPYYNRVVAITEVSLSATPETVTINSATRKVLVTQISDTVTVHRQSISNTPPELLAWTSTNPIIPINADGSFNKLICTGTGSCTVYQYR